MQLVLDFGNTQTKIFVFDGEVMINHLSITPKNGLFELKEILVRHQFDSAIWVASGTVDKKILEILAATVPTLPFNLELTIPFSVHYQTKETLGMDRLALACGGFAEFGLTPLLIIGLGTCITYDYVDENGYQGGGIAPGLEMRLRALNAFTHKLPLVSNKRLEKTSGKSTENSILHGSYFGMLKEIDGMIDHYKSLQPSIKIIMTGGDLGAFENDLKNSIFARPHLLARGLNYILRQQHAQN